MARLVLRILVLLVTVLAWRVASETRIWQLRHGRVPARARVREAWAVPSGASAVAAPAEARPTAAAARTGHVGVVRIAALALAGIGLAGTAWALTDPVSDIAPIVAASGVVLAIVAWGISLTVDRS